MPEEEHPRRKIGLTTLLIIGLVLGLIFKNIKWGMLIGILLGLAAVGLAGGKKKQ